MSAGQTNKRHSPAVVLAQKGEGADFLHAALGGVHRAGFQIYGVSFCESADYAVRLFVVEFITFRILPVFYVFFSSHLRFI